ncbi:ABC transporter permease [Fructilactobacillus ixorae]|uniref:ABC transporter permease n=1 Tax=Fructilactobacillus ixorae TaxID=1750535 RepID=A0ABY5C4W0_9LACO|nr:ABC transporter permease [Fructilactobacillus ixorae]USS93816.1 ABC transporter permease [Fructilactobacillus ixorae]
MHNLFKERLINHWNQLTRYLRYVFNDFFVIALMFFIGAVGLGYANFLKTVPPHAEWEVLVLLVLLTFGLQVGRLATLIVDPDRVFLAPQEQQLTGYFKQAFLYSFSLAAGMQMLVWIILMPFISVSLGWDVRQLLVGLVLMVGLKWDWLSYQFLQLRNHATNPWWHRLGWLVLLPAVIILLALVGRTVIAYVLTMVAIGVLSWRLTKQEPPLNWEPIVATEQRRMRRIYRFFALFTEVPMVGPQPKRRAYLDGLFQRLPHDQAHLYTNLYVKTFARDGETSSMYFRLLVVAAVILGLITNQALSIVVALTTLYLTGTQLRPFFDCFDNNVFTYLYPVRFSKRVHNFRQLFNWLLIIELVVALIAQVVGQATRTTLGITLVGGSFIIWWLSHRFLQQQVKREK